MSLESDLRQFTIRLQARRREIFLRTCALAFDSIVNGSPVTGAPGQPVDTGALRASWSLTFESPTEALISTNLVYAPAIEEGQQEPYSRNGAYIVPAPMTLRSSVGGFHSVKMTRAALQSIVDFATAEVAGVG